MPSWRRWMPNIEPPDEHIGVQWLDAAFAPTRWELLNRGWSNLPAALLICMVVLAIVVPTPSISLSLPSIFSPAADPSLASDADDSGIAETPARLDAPSVSGTPATPVEHVLAEITDAQSEPPPDAVEPANPPNELGRVPIIMYHAFVTDPSYIDEWTLTLDQFRDQLDWYRENDFAMVGMQSMIDGRFDVPAGKKPIILSFDDASAGQFGLRESGNGGYEVRPDTAVGVLEEYRQQYPEFAGPAFFAVLTWNCFESDGDPSTCKERLNWLIDHGYEVGNHTWDHVDMTDVDPEFFTKSIGSMKNWIDERIPQGPGNLSTVLVLPFGAFPDPSLHPDQRSWLSDGFWYLGEPVNLDLVLGVNGGPAVSPYSHLFDRSDVYRIASEPGILGYWREAMTSGASPVFVSDGDPDVVTIPADMEEFVSQDTLDALGLELRLLDPVASD